MTLAQNLTKTRFMYRTCVMYCFDQLNIRPDRIIFIGTTRYEIH